MANICDVFLQLRSTDQKYISIMSCPRGSFRKLGKERICPNASFHLASLASPKQRERQDETTIKHLPGFVNI